MTQSDKSPSRINFQALGVCDSVADEELGAGPWRVKMGFDPTGSQLHLGHAVGLFFLRRLQDMGHQVVVVVGEFTALIGDPTGRNAARPALTEEQIAKNAKDFSAQALKILDPTKTEFVSNKNWLGTLGAAGLIELSSKATVAQMIARDDFSKRLKNNAPVSLHELLYPLLQGQDSVQLCPDIEVGGQDQRFNLLMGRELMRQAGQKPQACLMTSILLGLDGSQKMSKSLGNDIALNDSPDEIFNKTMSISDQTMNQWIGCLGWEMDLATKTHPMVRKKALASLIVDKLHGPGLSATAQETWERRMSGNQWDQLAEKRVLLITPERHPRWFEVIKDMGWAKSGNEAKTLISQGAAKVNGEKITDAFEPVPEGEFLLTVSNRFGVKIDSKKTGSIVAQDEAQKIGKSFGPK